MYDSAIAYFSDTLLENYKTNNKRKISNHSFLIILSMMVLIAGCRNDAYKPPENPLFINVAPGQSGIDFRNDVQDDSIFNEITYRNFYNGGGVAIGDINNDGLADVFLTANQGKNKLFLNKGNFRFEDITDRAGINKKQKWSTGISMADVNGDGLLDIYVCAAGNVAGDKRLNELYINKGNLTFKEEAGKYHLQDSGAFHTQAAFFDYDNDGDLDVFLLTNNCLLSSSNYPVSSVRNIGDSVQGDKLMRNDGGIFKDVSKKAGIFQSNYGFGLGVSVGDINNDNSPDLYISNDFFEKDYLYINQRNGTFKEMSDSCIGHMSQSSMGADVADINNDGMVDIFTTDMLPEGDYRLKKNTAFEDYDNHQARIKAGLHQQLLANMLQLNNGDNTFSEVAQFAGVYATDWSWGALIFDWDNNGWKDIMVCNGMYLDVTDQDYIAYNADQDSKTLNKALTSGMSYEMLKKKVPSQAIPNYAFVNQKNMSFKNQSFELGLGKPGFSNGAAYADLDNDGDLDLIVNNLNEECSVFKNTIREKEGKHYIKVQLKGSNQNKFGIGASVTVYTKGLQQKNQNFPTRGFQSCVEPVLNFGLDTYTYIDSIEVLWPDDKKELVKGIKADHTITLFQSNAQQPSDFSSLSSFHLFEDVTGKSISGNITHVENKFVDFDVQRLIPHFISTEGPKIAVADVNGDGLKDFFMGSAKYDTAKLFIQQPTGKFVQMPQPSFSIDKDYEDAGSAFLDIDKDGDEDLVVCSGGNLELRESKYLQVRLYLNNGKGVFVRDTLRMPDIRLNASCVKENDYDSDGDEDLFIGGRSIRSAYGEAPQSFMLRNDHGTFKNVTSIEAPALLTAGMVTDASWADIDGDGRKELLIVGEWMPLTVLKYLPQTKAFVFSTLANTSGWWNCISAADLDNDGDIDFVVGNLGENTKFKADKDHPAKLYINDFDNNGTKECILSFFKHDGKEYPYNMRPDLTAQLPALKKKFLKYAAYAGKTIGEVFTREQLNTSELKYADEFRSCAFINNGKGAFTKKPLPDRAQFSPIYALLIDDINNDGFKDILAGGNLFGLKPELGRYDANYGTTFFGDGKNNFRYVSPKESGFFCMGEVRDIQPINTVNTQLVIVARNNEPLLLLKKTF